MSQQRDNATPGRERGVSLVLVALGLAMLLGLAGLAIDLATMYVARNEAQRSADAAALAGAKEFVADGATMGLTGGLTSTAVTDAATQAVVAGNANLVIGRNPNLETTNFNLSCPAPTGISGGCFDFSTTNDPRITVVVRQNIPTFFMKIFGITSVPVSATATAEAYNPQGSGPASTAQCLKPWLMPNCDYDHPITATNPANGQEANAACPAISAGVYPAYFVYPDPNDPGVTVTTVPNQPTIQPSDYGTVVMPTLASCDNCTNNTGGAIGEYLTVKPGLPQYATAPGEFYPVFLPTPNGVNFACPSCALADQQTSTAGSSARYREFIECCNTGQAGCGATTVNPISGNMVGPTGQGVKCLIHESANGGGQDTISFGPVTAPALPYTIYSGANNPYPYAQPPGTVISNSDSIVTVPLYDGLQLCPGSNHTCPSSETVAVEGMLQLFIINVGSGQNTVYANVLNISGCGGTAESGSTPIPAAAGSQIPVRLIHQ